MTSLAHDHNHKSLRLEGIFLGIPIYIPIFFSDHRNLVFLKFDFFLQLCLPELFFFLQENVLSGF